MTKKKLLAKAKEMGLDVTDKMTKAQIQSAIDASEAAAVEEETSIEVEVDTSTDDDVVVEFTPAEAEETPDLGDDPIIENLPPEAFIESKEEAVDPYAEENARRAKVLTDTLGKINGLSELSTSQLYQFAKDEGIGMHKGLSKHEAFRSIKRSLMSKVKRPKVAR
jgi:hypothetical protein